MTSNFHNIDDFEKLIELAEQISEEIIRLNAKINSLNHLAKLTASGFIVAMAISSLSFTKASLLTYLDNISPLYIILFLIVGSSILISVLLNYFTQYTLTRKLIRIEQANLELVFKMVHEYKDMIHNEPSLVSRAILELRLKRIQFHLRK